MVGTRVEDEDEERSEGHEEKGNVGQVRVN